MAPKASTLPLAAPSKSFSTRRAACCSAWAASVESRSPRPRSGAPSKTRCPAVSRWRCASTVIERPACAAPTWKSRCSRWTRPRSCSASTRSRPSTWPGPPIAESLEAVASDLDGAEGRRLVILLTDGEETCDGDPAAAIQGLIDSGVDVRINIVGFAIDDQDLKQQFSDWAGLGGGEYLDAGEAGELEAAMRQALRIPFRIEDSTGKTVGDGFVGDQPVEVPPGGYRVIVERADGDVVENVNVVPGDTLEIEID